MHNTNSERPPVARFPKSLSEIRFRNPFPKSLIAFGNGNRFSKSVSETKKKFMRPVGAAYDWKEEKPLTRLLEVPVASGALP